MNVHIWCPVQRSASWLRDLLAKMYPSFWADLLYDDDEACNEIRVLLFSFMERQERVSFWSVMMSLNAFIFSYPDLISRRCIGYGNKRSIPHVLCGLTKTRTYRKSHRAACMPSCCCLNIPAVAHLCSFPGCDLLLLKWRKMSLTTFRERNKYFFVTCSKVSWRNWQSIELPNLLQHRFL